jgi:CRISPR/Cas system CMR-associated protein Cmr5 small subunit
MPTEKIEWVSKTGLLNSLNATLAYMETKLKNVTEGNYHYFHGKVDALKSVIDEIERT